MSVRNFSRVFLKETGRTPSEYVEQIRMDAARRLLEDGGAAVKMDRVRKRLWRGSSSQTECFSGASAFRAGRLIASASRVPGIQKAAKSGT
ncbi:helix-turn-helix domain-containing protein [Cupriavidus basilensis]